MHPQSLILLRRKPLWKRNSKDRLGIHHLLQWQRDGETLWEPLAGWRTERPQEVFSAERLLTPAIDHEGKEEIELAVIGMLVAPHPKSLGNLTCLFHVDVKKQGG